MIVLKVKCYVDPAELDLVIKFLVAVVTNAMKLFLGIKCKIEVEVK